MFLERLLRTILAALWGVTYFPIGALIALVVDRINPRSNIFWNISRVYFWVFLALAGIRLTVKGGQYVPREGGVLIISNHQSAFDIPILVAIMPRPFAFVAKAELFKIPFLGWYMKKRGDIPLHRTALKSLEEVKQAAKQLKAGRAIHLFPEGTRSRDGTLGSFKRGGLNALMSSGVPLIPIAISGSYRTLPRGKRLITPQRVSVTIDSPYPVAGADEKEVVVGLRQRLADLLRAG